MIYNNGRTVQVGDEIVLAAGCSHPVFRHDGNGADVLSVIEVVAPSTRSLNDEIRVKTADDVVFWVRSGQWNVIGDS